VIIHGGRQLGDSGEKVKRNPPFTDAKDDAVRCFSEAIRRYLSGMI
jgi:hypothetical protein